MLYMQTKLFLTQTAHTHTAHTYRTAVQVKFDQMKLFRI